MPEAGIVYILINPSLKGMLKIGRTTRNAEDRAKELSNATGIPTPFFVAYEENFDDAPAAEQLVHTLLAERGCRTARNREFFSVELKVAIGIIAEAKAKLPGVSFGKKLSPNEEQAKKLARVTELQKLHPADPRTFAANQREIRRLFGELGTRPPVPAWFEEIAAAHSSYSGVDGELKDYKKALGYYVRAVELGDVSSCLTIGNMNYLGLGVKRSEEKAMDWWKRGLDDGMTVCARSLANAFYRRGEYSNVETCWRRYFEFSIVDRSLTDMYAQAGWQNFVREYLPQVWKGAISDNCADLVRGQKLIVAEQVQRFEKGLNESELISRDSAESITQDPDCRQFLQANAESRTFFDFARRYAQRI